MQIGPVTASDRNDQTGLRYRTTFAAVPPGARTAVVTLSTQRDPGASAGQYDDGYADNLSLTLNPAAPPAPASTSSPTTSTNQTSGTGAIQSSQSPTTGMCKVPNLTNLSLKAASKALSKVGCRLGKVSVPRRLRRTKGLVIRSQSPRTGVSANTGINVNVTLGRKPRVRRRRADNEVRRQRPFTVRP